MTKSLQRFGYLDMELKEDCLLGKKGEKLTAHEFHKSKTVIDDSALYKIKNAVKSTSELYGIFINYLFYFYYCI